MSGLDPESNGTRLGPTAARGVESARMTRINSVGRAPLARQEGRGCVSRDCVSALDCSIRRFPTSHSPEGGNPSRGEGRGSGAGFRNGVKRQAPGSLDSSPHYPVGLRLALEGTHCPAHESRKAFLCPSCWTVSAGSYLRGPVNQKDKAGPGQVAGLWGPSQGTTC